MKANHIPADVRIKARIYKYQYAIDTAFSNKRFYPTCKHCRITNVELSIEGDHRPRCPLRGMAGQIRYYEGLLEGLKG